MGNVEDVAAEMHDVAERDEIVNDDDTSFFTQNDKNGEFFSSTDEASEGC